MDWPVVALDKMSIKWSNAESFFPNDSIMWIKKQKPVWFCIIPYIAGI